MCTFAHVKDCRNFDILSSLFLRLLHMHSSCTRECRNMCISLYVNQGAYEFICAHNAMDCFDVVVNEYVPISNICTCDSSVVCTCAHMHKGERRYEVSAVML